MSLPEETNLEDTTEGFDMNSALDEISSGLFGQDSEEGEDVKAPVVGEEAPQTPTDGELPPQIDKPAEENAPAVQAVGAPNTWTKEAIAEWAAIPPKAQAEILKREQDMFKGIEQYKGKAELGDRYDQVVEPFRQALDAEGVDPVQLFQSFSANHYTLARGTPEQKVQLAANLLQSYGIPLEAVQAFVGGQPAPNPQFDQVSQRVQQLENQLTQRQNSENESRKANFRTEVETFSSDPKNSYFTEVADDIAHLLKTGVAKTLPDAYDQAVYRNPTTRQKEIDRITAEKISERSRDEAGRFAAAEAAKGANVKTKSKSANGTIPVGTLDETLEETLAKINARG